MNSNKLWVEFRDVMKSQDSSDADWDGLSPCGLSKNSRPVNGKANKS